MTPESRLTRGLRGIVQWKALPKWSILPRAALLRLEEPLHNEQIPVRRAQLKVFNWMWNDFLHELELAFGQTSLLLKGQASRNWQQPRTLRSPAATKVERLSSCQLRRCTSRTWSRDLSDATTYKKLAKDRTPALRLTINNTLGNTLERCGFSKSIIHRLTTPPSACTQRFYTKNTQHKPEDPSFCIRSKWHF